MSRRHGAGSAADAGRLPRIPVDPGPRRASCHGVSRQARRGVRGQDADLARVRPAAQQDRAHAGRHGRRQGRQDRHPRHQLGRICRDLHGRPACRRLRRAAVDHGGGRCAREDARRLRRQGAVPVGPVSRPGRALRRPAVQADPRRPHRLRFRARRLARLRALARRASDLPFELPLEQLDDFNIIYSSGTTGLPKGILHSHVMRDLLAVRFTAFDYGPDTISLASTPLYSNTTLVAVLATIGVGGTTILMPKSDVVKFLEIAAARARDPRHAGAGAISAHPGASRFRQVRPRHPSSASCRPARRCARRSRPMR